ncbi:MAG: YdeI/OmpD-associated family protein [Bacteroidota bacterium]
MEIGTTLYVTTRRQWRAWLRANCARKKEIWLIYYKKNSGKPRIPYNDSVEEALCYGWIDSILKPIDSEKYAQRFSPRRKDSKFLSEMNRERVRRLMKEGKMTSAGLTAIRHLLDGKGRDPAIHDNQLVLPAGLKRALKKDPQTWKNFSKFPESYKKIRIGWIVAARHRREIYRQRLRYFLRMTAQNKKFGMVK